MSILGLLVVFCSGFIGGIDPAPLKFIRKYQYEHWAIIGSFLGFIAIPWVALMLCCPDFTGAMAELPLGSVIIGNLFSLAWGIANILYLLCLVKIGFSLSQGILVGIAIPIGVITPMILKGTGRFADAPGPLTPCGLIIITGVILMIVAVILIAKAGFGRDKALSHHEGQGKKKVSSDFLIGLIMVILAGILSIGISFSFVYTQDAIGEVFIRHGMGQAGASFGVRTVTIFAGGLINVLYPLYLLFKNKSWGVFKEVGWARDFICAAVVGILSITSFVLNNVGMVLLGALGASVGFGVNQAIQMAGTQAVGFIAGEWKGVPRKYTNIMLSAIALLLVAVALISVAQAAL